jgi:hypothetical protein
MTREDRKKQKAVLALIARLPKNASIEDFNRIRFGANIIAAPQKAVRDQRTWKLH